MGIEYPNMSPSIEQFMRRELWSESQFAFMESGLKRWYGIWKVAIDYKWESGLTIWDWETGRCK